MQKILIIGNGITADILYQYLKLDGRYQVVGFAIDANYIADDKKFDLPVIPIQDVINTFPPDSHKAIVAIGYSNLNKLRAEFFFKIKDFGYQVETYIHSMAGVFNDRKEIGEGCIVLPGTVIEPYVVLAENTFIWANCVIGHHAQIDSNCWIASGSVVAGEAKVGANSFLGINASIANQVKIGAYNIIGSNTSIQKDTANNQVYLSGQGDKHRFSAEDYAQYYLK